MKTLGRGHLCATDGCPTLVTHEYSVLCQSCAAKEAAPKREQRHRIVRLRGVLDRLIAATQTVRRLTMVTESSEGTGAHNTVAWSVERDVGHLEDELADICDQATLVLMEQSIARKPKARANVLEQYR